MIPKKDQLLKNFLNCIDWEEKYLYIIELGRLLPKFPEKYRTNRYLVSGCQSHTWIKLVRNSNGKKNNNTKISFYGDSDALIIKGIIVIIFSLYQGLNVRSIIAVNAKSFLDKFKLTENLTVTRSQGIYTILRSIFNQAKNLL